MVTVVEEATGILIGSYEFEGPFPMHRDIGDQPGIYAVLSCDDDEYELVELGATDNFNSFLRDYNHQIAMSEYASMQLTLAVYYTPHLSAAERKGITEEILEEFDGEG